MRAVKAILFLTLYLVALCRPIAPLLDYYFNQDYFATVLCINQDKPQMQCNGQCALKNKVEAAQEKGDATSAPKVNFEDYPIGFVSTQHHAAGTDITDIAHQTEVFQFYGFDQISCLIQPPEYFS